MDKSRLLDILNNTTCLISNGERTERKLKSIYSLLWGLMLAEDDISRGRLTKIDCQFLIVGVDQKQAELHRAAFMKVLEGYPDPKSLSEGPSYKHVARVVGDEMTALRMFGLGAALGMWEVLLPEDFEFEPEFRDEAADLGLVVITGYPRELLQAATG